MVGDLLEPLCRELDGPVLDVGCGNKPYRKWFRQDVMYVGLDVPDPVSGWSAADVAGSAEELPFASGVFATVFSTQALAHLRRPHVFMKEAFRVLRHNGVLLVTARHVEGLNEPPRDYFRFSEYGLRAMAEDAGFSVQSVRPVGGLWLTLGFLLGCSLWSVSDGWFSWLRWPWRLLTIAPINLSMGLLDRIHGGNSVYLLSLMKATRDDNAAG
jgi:SAM-dependent methyltransferase